MINRSMLLVLNKNTRVRRHVENVVSNQKVTDKIEKKLLPIFKYYGTHCSVFDLLMTSAQLLFRFELQSVGQLNMV